LILKKILGMMSQPIYFILCRGFRIAKKTVRNAEKKIRNIKRNIKKKHKDKGKVVPDGGKKEKEKQRNFC
jgi:hypothetical protein